MPTLPEPATLRRLALHPAVWCLPLMVLLVWAAMPFNNGFYESWINFDPQGAGEQQEWQHTRRIFRYTSGILSGQLLALVVGAALSRRHRQTAALLAAVSLGVLLAAVTVAVAYPTAQGLETNRFAVPPFDDRALLPVLLRELAAFPLFAAAGVGLGILLAGSRLSRLVPLLVAGWGLAVLIGLLQNEHFNAWPWLLWTVPYVPAATAILQAGVSMNETTSPPVLLGDWGEAASIALLVSAGAYAVGLNALALLVKLRRRNNPTPDPGTEDRTPQPEISH